MGAGTSSGDAGDGAAQQAASVSCGPGGCERCDSEVVGDSEACCESDFCCGNEVVGDNDVVVIVTGFISIMPVGERGIGLGLVMIVQ